MDIIFELLFDLIFEGAIEGSKSKKLSKWIRYPLIIFLILFYAFVIGIFILTSYLLFKDSNIIGGLCVLLICLIIVIGTVIKFKNIKKENK